VRGEQVQRIAGVAYGLRLRGLPAQGLMPVDSLDWPVVEVLQAGGEMPSEEPWLGDDDALLELDGIRRVALSRAPSVATFRGPRLAADDLLHPYLGPVGITFGRWFGRETFHAGAFLADGGVWALVGGREAGKSSLLAALARRGVPVFCDDLVVIDGLDAFAGPRMLDLREHPAPALADARDVEPARRGTRWRVRLGPVDPVAPFRGWVFLRWSDSLRLDRIPAATTLARLAGWRGRPELPSDPKQMLELGALPAWELHRPRGWHGLDETIEAVRQVTLSVF
jgi:hypothetical protein